MPRAKRGRLIREGKGELLMKGSLHTDELMHAVTANETGLRTERRSASLRDGCADRYRDLSSLTRRINIFPDLDAKNATSCRTLSTS